MAVTAVRKTETVTKTTVWLALDDDETQFLVDVLNRIGGSPVCSRRKYASDIKDSLKAAGVSTVARNPSDIVYSSAIDFKDSDLTPGDDVPF